MKVLLFDSGFGLIPSLKWLLAGHIDNDYHIEMEDQLFPFGNKNETDLSLYIKDKLLRWNNQKYDRIYIVCNTISVIIKKFNLGLSSNIRLIIDINEAIVKQYNASIFGTKVTCSYFKNKGVDTIDGSHLVKNIENCDIELLIKQIKQLKFKNEYVVIGCTHFTHILFLLRRYHPYIKFIDSYSLQFQDLKSGNSLSITLNDKAHKIINNNLFSHNLFTL